MPLLIFLLRTAHVMLLRVQEGVGEEEFYRVNALCAFFLQQGQGKVDGSYQVSILFFIVEHKFSDLRTVFPELEREEK